MIELVLDFFFILVGVRFGLDFNFFFFKADFEFLFWVCREGLV